MTKKPITPAEPTEKDYFKQATSWEIDRMAALMRSERIAWWTAGAAITAAICSGIAIMLMMPLKRVEPYVVRVDNTTGIVDVVNSLRTSVSDYSEAVTKYFLVKYVRGREGYNYSQVDAAYNEVMLLSGPLQARQYSSYILPRNPDSPVNKLEKKGTIEIKVKSVAFVRKDVASVRYLRIDRVNGVVQRQTNWIATVSFEYVKATATETIREVNPLGFQVKDYRTDPEVITNGEVPQVDSTLPVATTSP